MMGNNLQRKAEESLESIIIIHVSDGGNQFWPVRETGCLLICGNELFGQLVHDDYMFQCSTDRVSHFDHTDAQQFTCDKRHSLVLDDDCLGHQVLGLFSRKHGQLSTTNGRVKLPSLPQNTMEIDDGKIFNFCANKDHSVVLCTNGQLHTFVRGLIGSLVGQFPWCFTTYSSKRHAALGGNHALLLTSNGDVYMLTCCDHGIHSDLQMATNLQQELEKKKCNVEDSKPYGIKFQQIALRARHSTMVTDDDLVMTRGSGEHGQPGWEDEIDHTNPDTICLGKSFAQQHLIFRVCCGSEFTYFTRTTDTIAIVFSQLIPVPTSSEKVFGDQGIPASFSDPVRAIIAFDSMELALQQSKSLTNFRSLLNLIETEINGGTVQIVNSTRVL
ncbi:hypothetical protein ACH5RR_026605 [Cinchona calisaya]|uniref:Uncharacterized protein n=1 Tax=Cinchona calisaya TaxID=153742 RepID=A0ABD2Z815_9GENT